MKVTFVDELDCGYGWLDDSPLRRAGHALAAAGRVWVFDPIDGDGVEERILSLGEPAAVVQLLDRHDRDAARLAARLDVPHEIVPTELPGSPFQLLVLMRSRLWREVALWWPERRVLVCADAVGTIPHYFRAGTELIGIHPLLRLRPPRRLKGLDPLHVLVGHGEGVHGEGTGRALDDAIAHARRRIPRWVVGLPKLRRTSSRRAIAAAAGHPRAAAEPRSLHPPPTLIGWGDDACETRARVSRGCANCGPVSRRNRHAGRAARDDHAG